MSAPEYGRAHTRLNGGNVRKVLFGLLVAALLATPLAAQRRTAGADVKHVLLISVDGLHALNVSRFVASHPHSALAELTHHGVTYTNARTPANSDSFPGLLALVTGGSPISHGMFYDVSYDRSLFAPSNTTCSGTPGNTIVYDETIDVYSAAGVSQDVIDPTQLPRGFDAHGNCGPVFRTTRFAATPFLKSSRLTVG
jgi:hypothetical protein